MMATIPTIGWRRSAVQHCCFEVELDELGIFGSHSPEVIRHPLDLKDLTFRQRVLMFAKPNLDRVA